MQMQAPQIDTLYQGYGRTLYKITGDEQSDDVMNMLSADGGSNNSANVQTSASDVGSGVSTATISGANGSYQVGKVAFYTTPIDGVNGFILGVDPKDGMAKFNIGDGTSKAYIFWDGSSLTIAANKNSSLNFFDNSGNTTTQVSGDGITLTNATGTAVLSIQGILSLGGNAGQGVFGNFLPVGNALYDTGSATRQWNNIYCVTLHQSSDIRLKTSIESLDYGLATINALEPLSYYLRGKKHLGFSAQAVHSLVPEITENAYAGSEVGSATLNASEIIPILVKAVQELSARVVKLEQKLP